MVWRVQFKSRALNQLRLLDSVQRQRIQRYLNERIAVLDDPRQLGLALQGKSYKGLWRYRVGDYRILAEIKDDVLTILVIEIGHRRDIYK